MFRPSPPLALVPAFRTWPTRAATGAERLPPQMSAPTTALPPSCSASPSWEVAAHKERFGLEAGMREWISVLTRTSRSLRTVRTKGTGQLGPEEAHLYVHCARISRGRTVRTAHRGTTTDGCWWSSTAEQPSTGSRPKRRIR